MTSLICCRHCARHERRIRFVSVFHVESPGWMKANGYAGWLCVRAIFRHTLSTSSSFCRHMRRGRSDQAVTSQNEVDTIKMGMACFAGVQDRIIAKHLGPHCRAPASTKIWLLDHNYNLGRVICSLDDLQCGSIAIRWPGTGMQAHGHDVESARAHLMSAYIGRKAADYTSRHTYRWVSWTKTFSEALQNGCGSITGWNLALDEKGRQHRTFCGGLVRYCKVKMALVHCISMAFGS